MKIAYCANRALYHLLPTAINSLLSNNPHVERIYLLIEDDDIDYIRSDKITFINCTELKYLIRDGVNCTRRFPYMAMVRCFLAQILNEDKVIYLDVDTIVNGDLSGLWSYNMGGNCIAAREESNGYFNSGVLLMNLKLIRALGLDRTWTDLLKTCKFVFPDQDAMNIAFINRIATIPHKYNKLGKVDIADDDEIIIRHFAGRAKPWTDGASDEDKLMWNKYQSSRIDDV